MRFELGKLHGVFIISMENRNDHRGYFARTWCKREFADNGIDCEFVQSSVSYNIKAGTLRGMHMQRRPKGENKLIRCLRGAVYDVILDLRANSKSYLQWQSVELSAINQRMLYVPEGVAHGFQTLEDGTELSYHISEFYSPKHSFGVRWNDEAFNIRWPEDGHPIMSKADQSWPDFDPNVGVPQ